MTSIAHRGPKSTLHKRHKDFWKIPIHLMFIFISITMIVPLIMIFSISISEESQILGIGNGSGFSILPKGFSLVALLLALVMIVTCVPFSLAADETVTLNVWVDGYKQKDSDRVWEAVNEKLAEYLPDTKLNIVPMTM